MDVEGSVTRHSATNWFDDEAMHHWYLPCRLASRTCWAHTALLSCVKCLQRLWVDKGSAARTRFPQRWMIAIAAPCTRVLKELTCRMGGLEQL